MKVILLKIMAKAGPRNTETIVTKSIVVTEKKIETVIEIVIVIETVTVIEIGIETGKRVDEGVEVGPGIEVMTDTVEVETIEVVETIEGTIIKVKAEGGNHLYFGTYPLLDLSMLHHYNIRPCRPLGKYLLL